MEERRGARVGTVSGLALLTGGTAIAAVAGGTQSIFATVLLGLLALVMGHALLTEIHRQARRRAIRWAVQDTVNAALLATWSVVALSAALLPLAPLRFRAVGLILTFAYALSSAFFITQRRSRIVAARHPPSTPEATPTARPATSTPEATPAALAPAARPATSTAEATPAARPARSTAEATPAARPARSTAEAAPATDADAESQRMSMKPALSTENPADQRQV